ncbi:hypothetical protein RR48_12539 [Papilio machaon]|uniref:Uncharacterized protein n=1 Tax=Papilio machaon TaxID=76193 RepID=A0A194RMH4_PAPMA|nr:hypothetical protein RR48_12539 [Papilio machaon]
MGMQNTGMAATYKFDAAWAGLPQDGPMIWSRLREYPGCGLHRTDHRGDLWGRPMPSRYETTIVVRSAVGGGDAGCAVRGARGCTDKIIITRSDYERVIDLRKI